MSWIFFLKCFILFEEFGRCFPVHFLGLFSQDILLPSGPLSPSIFLGMMSCRREYLGSFVMMWPKYCSFWVLLIFWDFSSRLRTFSFVTCSVHEILSILRLNQISNALIQLVVFSLSAHIEESGRCSISSTSFSFQLLPSGFCDSIYNPWVVSQLSLIIVPKYTVCWTRSNWRLLVEIWDCLPWLMLRYSSHLSVPHFLGRPINSESSQSCGSVIVE